MSMHVLVIDIGGSHVKMTVSGAGESRRFKSSVRLTPDLLVARVISLTGDWRYDAVSIGYPGAVNAKGPTAEPGNLGSGWVDFDFKRAFRKPVRIVNDAVMQALGGYEGGRMLFLGLGTGVGSSLITEHVVVPLELGCLSFGADTIVGRLGRRALDKHGTQRWIRDVAKATRMLREAFAADYVLLGGGNARKVQPLPEGARRGGNTQAFNGGFRLWEETVEPHDQSSPPVWRVVR
jgi:polyphosphate glucokinase